jgi:hypothetical protein
MGRIDKRVDSKRKSRGEVRDIYSPRGEKDHHFVRRLTGYTRSSFW